MSKTHGFPHKLSIPSNSRTAAAAATRERTDRAPISAAAGPRERAVGLAGAGNPSETNRESKTPNERDEPGVSGRRTGIPRYLMRKTNRESQGDELGFQDT